jgi:hypothetical protein
MKKFVVLPALLAAVFVAHPACAASNKKSAAATAPVTPQWAQMPAGNKHSLRKSIGIRSADQTSWKIHKAVTLTARGYDKQCVWDGHVDAAGQPQSKPKSLNGAILLVDTDVNPPRLNVVFSDKTVVSRELSYSDTTADSRWLSSTPKDDWNYYVLFEDTNPNAKPKDNIDKRYRVEIFPPESATPTVHAHCDPERPDKAVTIARASDMRRGLPCEAGTGNGGEPH